jgi:ABC-2 type transport system permease protein
MMAIVTAIAALVTFVLAYYHDSLAVQGALASANSFYGGFWATGGTYVTIFAGIIFGGDAIAGEFQDKTGYFLMGLPIRRATVYVGKFIAAFAASLVAILVYLAVLLANGAYYLHWDAFPVSLGESFAIMILYLLALLGAVFLFSSLFKTSLYATLVVAVLFLFGFSIIQELVVVLVKIEPWFLISYAQSVIGYPFLSSLPAHVTTVHAGRFSQTSYNPTFAEGLGILGGYFLLTAIAGLYFFEKEEFT